MPVNKPDIYQHNNPVKAFVDSDFVRGGGRIVADLTALYALAANSDQLKENVTKVHVISAGAEYKLTDDTNIGNSGGWALETDGGGTPGGANTQIQFNDSGAFGGSTELTWDGTMLKVGATIQVIVPDSDSYLLSLGNLSNGAAWQNWIEDGGYGGTIGSMYYDFYISGGSKQGSVVFAPGGRLGIGIGYTTVDAALDIKNSAAGIYGLRIKGATGQTADLIRVENSAGVAKVTADKDGNLAANNLSGTNTGDISLTTIGTSGAATLTGSVLNIPQYTGAGSGGGLTIADYVSKEVPTGTINGTTGFDGNDTFYISNAVASNTDHLFKNGQLLENGDDYTIVGTILTFLAGAIPITGDKIRMSYFK